MRALALTVQGALTNDMDARTGTKLLFGLSCSSNGSGGVSLASGCGAILFFVSFGRVMPSFILI